MAGQPTRFDCASALTGWTWDPARSAIENLERQCEVYSSAYRRLVAEVRRLEEENQYLGECVRIGSNQEITELQRVVDATIAVLDPDREDLP